MITQNIIKNYEYTLQTKLSKQSVKRRHRLAMSMVVKYVWYTMGMVGIYHSPKADCQEEDSAFHNGANKRSPSINSLRQLAL